VPESRSETLSALDGYIAKALAASPDVAAAQAAVEQAHHTSALARADYIPDIGVGLSYTMIDGVSFLPRRAVGLSIQGSWTVLDWGKRGAVSRQRRAGEYGDDWPGVARDRVSVEVERAHASWRAERGGGCSAAVDARRAALTNVRDRCEHRLVSATLLSAAEAELAE
jgi:hypothetical protein